AASGFQRILSTLTLAIFPTLYFFTFLYYTDTGSTFFILFAYLMCLYGNHKTSAFLGFCGVMFRQTNIVWTVFCGGSVVAEKLSESWKVELLKSKEKKNLLTQNLFSESIRIVRFVLGYFTSFKNLSNVILLIWPYITVMVAFATFIVLNGGIVLGDRSSHEACLHFPQLFYFFSFSLFFSFPLIVTPSKVISFLHSVRIYFLRYSILTIVS
ncbi:dol-P-Glc:Glc(2)Man(9)GlcNAc(2)-PP-Dol alpha-1,2-glucosyltransferase-like, partial [Protobothrops mucrosquamatus]|uniref:dol-P-Glc:Glc(2)Man(9)GlcNAc(2)-PP-Dol alpha-1,2-glucosyltransferase-like n=1 Tax=Protobothrops mucrosquamatus TaxID=103944 RepID=UPI0010FB5689